MLPFVATLAQILAAVLVQQHPNDNLQSIYDVALAQAMAVAEALGFVNRAPAPDPNAGQGHAWANDMTTAADVLYTQLLVELTSAAATTRAAAAVAAAPSPLTRDLVAALRTGHEAPEAGDDGAAPNPERPPV